MKKRPTPKRQWQPMTNTGGFRPKEKTDALIKILGEDHPELHKEREIWSNDKYLASVNRRDDGSVESISIRRQDRGWPRDWRDFQRIKNEIAGPEIEACELYPAESRLVDTANQFWLWCAKPDEFAPFGFFDGRVVSGSQRAKFVGAGQRELDDDVDETMTL